MDTLTILGGGPGLGFYIPGAVLAARAERPVELLVVESLLPPEKQELIPRSRDRFHQDLRFARMSQRLARGIADQLDPTQTNALLRRWHKEKRRSFIIFSGFWGPIVGRYASEHEAAIDLCHVDCAESPSWRVFGPRFPGMRDVWLADTQLHQRIDVSTDLPLCWAERSGRLLVHGGGWGVGTYRECVQTLGLPLDVLHCDPRDAQPGSLLLDPDWFPWRPNAGRFPPLDFVEAEGIRRVVNDRYPALFDVIRRATAIVSKPGAGTLIDSLSAATPLLLLEPCGAHEQANGELWKTLGFAIELERWRDEGCRTDVLEAMHHNLLAARERTPLYRGPDA